MSPAQAFVLISAILACIAVILLIAIDAIKQAMRRRAERRELDEHTGEYRRQIG